MVLRTQFPPPLPSSNFGPWHAVDRTQPLTKMTCTRVKKSNTSIGNQQDEHMLWNLGRRGYKQVLFTNTVQD